MVFIDYEGFENQTPEQLKQGPRPAPGKAHLLVTECKETDDGQIAIEFDVIAHEVPEQTEKKVFEWLYPASSKAGARKRVASFFLATGVQSREAFIKAAKKDAGAEVNERDAIGRTVCVDLEENEYQGKVRTRVGFNFYDPMDPESDGYPKNEKYLAAMQRDDDAVDGDTSDAPADDDIPF